MSYFEQLTILIENKRTNECFMFYEIAHYLYDTKTHLANKKAQMKTTQIHSHLVLLKNDT